MRISDWSSDVCSSDLMGVDGISMLFVLLTTFLMPLCILASWEAIGTRVTEYMIAFLVMETLMIGVFCALDSVLFYLYFEAGLIPMFLIRSEEHTSEFQSLMRISYAVFCLTKLTHKITWSHITFYYYH